MAEGPTDIIDLMVRSDGALQGRKGEAAWKILEFIRDGQFYASLHEIRERYYQWKQTHP